MTEPDQQEAEASIQTPPLEGRPVDSGAEAGVAEQAEVAE